MTTSVTRSCFTKQHQNCKTNTKTDFFLSQTGLVLRPTVSDHISLIIIIIIIIIRKAGAAAERATELKIAKYSGLQDKCIFQWSRLVHSMRQLVTFWSISGERSPPRQVTRERERESAFLFQRLSVVIQRFNAILLHNCFEAADHLGWWSFQRLQFLN